MGRTLTRWLIPLPAILFAVFPQTVYAEPVAGLNAVGYIVTEIPPTKSDTIYETCGTELENNINRNFNGEPFGTCPVDYFMIHYTGFITIPANNTIQFMIAADDGGTIQIGDTEFGTWDDKGCSWSEQTTAEFPANTYALDGWLYEDGGSTCLMLAWNINDAGWEIVPDSAFTTNGAPTTTTTTTTTTTSTTTTLPETTTTTSSTTTLPPTTTTTTSTTVPQTTTSTTTTSTTTTTTTQVPWTPPQTTTTTTEPEPATTTTTSEPETETTLEETTTTVPDETVPETTELETTVPATTVPDETVPDETDAPTTTEPLEETTTSTEPEEVEDSSTTTIPDPDPTVETPEELEAFVEELDIQEDEPITDAKVEQILEVLADATPAQVVAAVEQLLTTNITTDQAAEIASTPEVLAAITEEQAEQLFEELDVTELDNTQLEAFTEAIQEAPTKVKEAFEKTIDIFGSQFDDYVPTGSNIPVNERRTLVAVGALIAAIPSTRIRR